MAAFQRNALFHHADDALERLVAHLGHHIGGAGGHAVDHTIAADGGNSWIFRGPGDGGGGAVDLHGNRCAAHLNGEVGVVQRGSARGGGAGSGSGAAGGGTGPADIDRACAFGRAIGDGERG